MDSCLPAMGALSEWLVNRPAYLVTRAEALEGETASRCPRLERWWTPAIEIEAGQIPSIRCLASASSTAL